MTLGVSGIAVASDWPTLGVATASIGVQQVSGLVVHVVLSAFLLIWAGRSCAPVCCRRSGVHCPA